MFTQIRWRMVGWSVLVVALILVLVGGAAYETLSRSLISEVDRDLAARGDVLASNLHELAEARTHLEKEGYRGGLFLLLVAPDGRVLANPQDVSPQVVPTTSLYGILPHYTTQKLDGARIRLYIRPLWGLSRPTAFLIVGQSLATQDALLQQLLIILVASGGVGVLLSLAGGWFLAGRSLVPVQRAFQRQREFVADASHELRTPLTVLQSATDLLLQHQNEPLTSNSELFDDIRQEIGRMERLTNDLLMLARSDLHELGLAVGDVDVVTLASDVVRRLTPLAQEKGIALNGPVDNQSPLVVEGDPDRLQQVLLIILDNALKHTPAGGTVSVLVKRHGRDVEIQVVDTGEGIPAEHLPLVFGRFYRVDQARSRAQGGTGLGLSIARSLVAAHDGQMSLSSEVGVGTTVLIRLRFVDQQPSLAGRLGQFASRVAHGQVPGEEV